MPVAERASTSLAKVHLTDSGWSFIAAVLLAAYLCIHIVRDLYYAGKYMLKCCSRCSICSSRCCRRDVPEADDNDTLLTVVKTTAKGQKAHLTDKCPSLKQITVYTTEVKDICKHCRRITLEEILDNKKKIK